MILEYVGKKEFELVPQLGGRKVRPGDKVIVRSETIAKQLLATERWQVEGAKPKPKPKATKTVKKPKQKESGS